MKLFFILLLLIIVLCCCKKNLKGKKNRFKNNEKKTECQDFIETQDSYQNKVFEP